MNLLTKGKSFLFLLISVLFVSCGNQSSNQFIKDINVHPYYENDDVFIKLETQYNMGNVALPFVELPIIIPNGNRNIGTLMMGPSLGGSNSINFTLNLSEVAQISSSRAKLPNGSSLPLIGDTELVEIGVGPEKKIKIYIAISDTVVAFGAAIPIKNFDAMGSQVGTTNVFPVFNVSNVFGAAGIYTSSTAGKNGIGIFTDLSRVINLSMLNDLKATSSLTNVNTNSSMPSNSKLNKIKSEAYELHRKKAKLKLY